jgi:hypothetical protein
MEPLVGRTFGRWKVVGATTRTVQAQNLKAWICECQCQRKTKRLVAESSLLSCKSRCCGKCPDNAFRIWNPKKTD